MKRDIGTQLVAIVVSLLLALSMTPAFNVQSAFADEPAERPATTGGDVPLEGPAENTGLPAEEEADGPVAATVREDGSLVAEGLIYKSEGNGAVLVGFEDGASLDREVSVPERLTDGALEYAVKGVSVAEGQTAPGVLSLGLPQTVEDVDTKSLAASMPALARVSVDGRGGAYSSANGMLFRQESITASSDGSTTRIANRELVWAPPAMVIARIPGTCKTVAPGAFVDDKALETVMVFSIVDSVAKAEKDEGGNVTKEGAFTDEQIAKVNIVTPMETVVSSEGERINTDAFLSEDAPLNEKHTPWCDCGFSTDRFTVGIPYGSTSLAVAVPEDGKVGTPEITIGHYTDHPEWDPKGDTGEPQNGLVFEYKADMTVSVTWKGDKAAVPSHLEFPAYVIENGVKTAVTEVAPGAFEGATQLESVVIPEGVATIGKSAFEGCANLKDASLPSILGTVKGTDVGSTIIGSPLAFESSFKSSADASAAPYCPEQLGGLQTPSSDLSSTGISAYATSTKRIYAYGGKTALFGPSGSGYAGASYGQALTFTWDFGANYTHIYVKNSIGATGYGYSCIELRESTGNGIAGSQPIFVPDYGVLASDPKVIVSTSYSFSPDSTYTLGPGESVHIPFGSSYSALYIRVDAGTSLSTLVGAQTDPATVNTAFGKAKQAQETADAAKTAASTAQSTANTAKNSVGSSSDAASSSGTTAWSRIKNLQSWSSNYLTGTASGNTLTLKKQTTSGTTLASVYTTDGTYSKDEVNNLLGKTYTSGDTVKKAIDAAQKAGTDAQTTANAAKSAAETNASNISTLDGKVSGHATDIKNLQDGKVDASAFKPLKVEDVDEAQKGSYPTTYRKGYRPALPVPTRQGFTFKGWTTNHGVTEAKAKLEDGDFDHDELTVTAVWEEVAPEANVFFADAPLDSTQTGAPWSTTIAVKLTGDTSKTSVSGIQFALNDMTGLLAKPDDVRFAVGDRADSLGSEVGFDQAVTGPVTLASFEGGGKGVYVKITIPAGGINKDRVVGSQTAGDYVASLARMTYAGIA